MPIFSRWLARRRYRRAVINSIRWILIGMPAEAFAHFLSAYPGIAVATDDAYRESVPVELAAVQITTSSFADFVLSYPPRARETALNDFKRAALSRGGEIPSDEQPIVAIIFTAEARLDAMVALGRIEKTKRDVFMNEIIGALHGRDFEERSRLRMNRYLRDASGIDELLRELP